jgi:4-hydroxy-tetrahydrodipicolinate reductase
MNFYGTDSMNKIAVCGAAGRMGLRLVDLIHADPDVELVAAIEREEHPKLGNDAGALAGIGEIGVSITSDISTELHALIDFSQPAGADFAVDYCREQGVPLVMATTGLEESTIEKIRDAAKTIPIVWAPSMSLAVNLSMKLVEMAGRALKNHSTGVDVEIIERHHRYKVDSPSGTALKFGEIVAQSMQSKGQTNHQHGREGIVGQRPAGEIGYHAVRVGDNPGQHTIVFGMLGETIEIEVAASNRDCYAAGAIAAAKFVTSQPAGLYNMYDVLGL